jgi:hypothetical protein
MSAAILAVAAGLALRGWLLREFFEVSGDSAVYGGLAKNLLLHGRYALSGAGGEMVPTLMRLPGYPLFLALCFRVFGMENYASAAWAQIALELLGCLLLADFAQRIAPAGWQHGAGLATLWLAALCPFSAIYAAEPLTEAPSLFAISLALWAVGRFHSQPGWPSALWFTFAAAFAALLRPDGVLVGVALAPAMMAGLRRAAIPRANMARMALICVLLGLAPFAWWTWRNWQVFHVFEPLAPRYANDPGEPAYPGWQRWVKTWSLDFVSTYEIYWNVPGGPFDVSKLPARAFDTPAERAETAALAAQYEDNGRDFTPDMDARFARLAGERVRAHPLRFYLCLPLGRLADMWLRPRVENLPIDLDWWVYAHHDQETQFSWFYVGLNAFYLLLAVAGLCMRPRLSTPRTKTRPRGPRLWPWMLAYMALRSALLMTLEAPEARYTLECFPMLFVLGGISLYRFTYVGLGSVLKLKASLGRG